ncbi:hypothetical protein MUK42_19106 [Musa troglodytarum]|uniref:Uncharacterized protein n=1 Tax=Musa troglodytarum TaxID=320322 RepID=A0A9E7EUW1_9LILI|nr:hypothetical protein MUK42_19106 [Musa troglodytarum]
MESAREARRRRILERGTDRLAFITGQARSVPDSSPPPSPSPPPPKEAHPKTSVAPLSEDEGATISRFSDQYRSQASGPAGERTESDEIHGDKKEDDICACESGNEAKAKTVRSGRDSEPLTGAMAPRPSDEVVDAALPTAPRVKEQLMFSSKQVSHSVAASENIRLIGAVVIALLVILSNHGYAFSGAVMGSILNFRPLFLVMLTDVTVVLGLLITNRGTDAQENERARMGKQEHGWPSNIGDTLEVWWMLRTVSSAVFMDCSICAVIMIAGLCV